MKRFRMIGAGEHRHHGRILVKGDEIDSESDLVKIFPEKFQYIGEVASVIPPRIPAKSETKVPAPTSSHEEDEGEDGDEGKNELENDVTEDFPTIAEQDLRVIQVDKTHFNVVDPLRPTKPLNKEPLTRAKTAKFVL